MRWRILALLCAAELLGMSPWFAASAAAPQLADLWNIDPGDAAALTSAVQLGFVAGTAVAAFLNLADLLPARVLFAASALLAAASNAAVLAAGDLTAALPLRFATGFFLAGVYPPAMKMMATWFASGRGVAIGALVGALTVGKAAPYLLGSLQSAGASGIVLGSSLAAVVAALLVGVGYGDGPHAFERRPFSWALAGTVLRDRPTRLAIGGYLGHMWELYAVWAGVSLFFHDHFVRDGAATVLAAARASLAAFAVIAAGGAGAVLAGAWADRVGRENIAIAALVVSGACSLVMGWLIDAPTALLVAIGLVWGFAVVADSAQFSALVTEVAPRHAVGTALTLQTSMGFLLTAGTIWALIRIEQVFGWGVAFSFLAIGPVLGIPAMLRLRALRRLAPHVTAANAGKSRGPR